MNRRNLAEFPLYPLLAALVAAAGIILGQMMRETWGPSPRTTLLACAAGGALGYLAFRLYRYVRQGN